MKRKGKLILLMALGIFGISCSGPLVKLALQEGAHPVTVAFWRLAFSALFILPAVFINSRHRLALRTLEKKPLFLLALSGVLLAFHFLFWFISLSLTSTFAATVILSVQPLLTLLGAALVWRERPKQGALWGILIAMAGTLLLAFSSSSQSDSLMGSLYSFLGAVCLSGYLLCNKALRHRLSLTVHTFMVYGICAVMLFCLALVMHAPLLITNARIYALCLLLALMSTLCGHSVFNYLLKYLSAGTVAALQLGEPVGAALFAYILFMEIPSAMVLISGLLILIGILWFTVRENRAVL